VAVAEGVLGAAKDGIVMVLIVVPPIISFQRRHPRPTRACAPALPLGDT